MTHDAQPVTYAVADGVATVTLNRPERRNAMNDALLDDLLERLEAAVRDPAVRVVVLTGAGGSFCVGADLAELTGEDFARADRDEQIAKLRRHARISELLHEAPKVTIAAVDGACAGAGLALACAADLRFASDAAVFRSAFVGAGMSGDFGGGWTLTRLLGGARARSLLLRNPKLDPSEAAAIGLVDEVFPRDAFAAAVAVEAARLAAQAPLAVAGIKHNLLDAGRLGLVDALEAEGPRHIDCGRSEDAAEAARAFLAKRTPTFHGR